MLPYPVISAEDLAKIMHINNDGTCPASPRTSSTAATTPRGGGPALRDRLAEICAEVSAAIGAGARLIMLSDRGAEAAHDAAVASRSRR